MWDLETGLLTWIDGLAAMTLQFVVFPPVAKKYGVLNCLKVVTFFYPVAYVLTPFAVLMPTPLLQQLTISFIMLIKCLAGVFAFPCTTILLTNSAGSLRLLGTLNGVATSISAIGRGSGPSIAGGAFTYGIKIGYVIIPWWLLAIIALLGHISCHWLVEMEGFGSTDDDKDDDAIPKDSQGIGEPNSQQIRPDTKGLPPSTSPLHINKNSMRKKSTPIATIREEREQEAQHAASQEIALSASMPATASRPVRSATYRRSNDSPRSSLDPDVSTSASPVGMPNGIGPKGKGRQMSNNLGLSEGLGRTMVGGGFGTRGPNLG